MKTQGLKRWLVFSHLAVCGIPAFAAAPMVKTQPGFYRMMLGDFEITALNDCVVPYPVSTMPNATPEQIKDGLSEMRLNAPVGMSYNAFLINTGSKLVMIDTGTGGKLDSDPGFHGCGHLLRNLSAAGYQPSQIDEIYITHVGPDHVGGLTIEKERAFPNAIVRAAKSEVDSYIEPAKIEAALAAATDKSAAKTWFDFQRNLFEPYLKAGKLETFDRDVTFPSGVTALATHGHTPGHTSYIVKSEGQTLIVMGDLVHWGAVQFPYPTVYTQFDADRKAATEQRIRVFKLAGDNDYWVAGAHLSFPGIGHVRSGKGRFFWIPVQYSIPEAPPVDETAMQIPAVSLPLSSFLNTETRAALKKEDAQENQDIAAYEACGDIDHADAAHAPPIRKCQAEAFYRSAGYKQLYDKYPATMSPQQIGGIYTEVFTPVGAIARENAKRVLIDVHGGGFLENAQIESHLESVPIASIGKIKVISIDYRQAPEFAFPSASEDVGAVYRELLKTYEPKNIGIYGCSAGGLLTAESVAWLQKEHLPLPGAIAMLCEGAGYWTEGDTGYIAREMIGGNIWGKSTDNPYFKGTDPNDPLAFPIRSPSVMAHFPPSLLVAATRDPALSSVVQTHSVLVSHGVEAELHVWEGLGHAFFFDLNLPQSGEVYAVIAKFFDKHLGQ